MSDSALSNADHIVFSVIRELLPDDGLLTFLSNGSKKIRSKMALLLLRCFGKEPNNDIYKILAVGELFHNASLLHDDVIDDCDLRRGKTPICKKFSSNISILCGDYIVSRAVSILSDLKNDEIANIFNECVSNMAIAEIKQYFLRNKIPKLDDYIGICKGKLLDFFQLSWRVVL